MGGRAARVTAALRTIPYRDEQYRTGVAARGAKRAAKSVSFGTQVSRRSDS